jgi:hypothetical protein
MEQIPINRYLFERLRQLGVQSVFGVPGDYELIMLDEIPNTGLDWKGNPNELNASYAVSLSFLQPSRGCGADMLERPMAMVALKAWAPWFRRLGQVSFPLTVASLAHIPNMCPL